MPKRTTVTFLTSNYPRWEGDSTTPFVLHLARDLRDEGWDVDVLAPHYPGAARDEVLDGVPVHRFRYLLPESAQTVCYGGGALVNIRRSRAELAKLPALVASELAATVAHCRSRSSLIHAHWLVPQGAVAASAAPMLRLPWIATVHGGDVFGLQQAPIQRVKSAVLERASAVTVNSSVTRARVADLAPGVEPVTIPMGVEIEPADASLVEAARRELSGDRPLVVFVGRVVEEKGVFDLLAAAPLVRDAIEDVTIAIVGDGQDLDEVRRRVTELGLDDTVTCTGWRPHEQVAALQTAADVVVVPSRTGPDGWVEAQGLSAVEALAAGRAVVATDHGGLRDSVVHESTGLLVPEAEPARLADAVVRLLRDRDLATRLGAAGRTSIRETYDRRGVAQRFSGLYEQVLSRRR